jgi:hypothetical protein
MIRLPWSAILLVFTWNVGARAERSVTFTAQVQPVLREFCVDCHNDEKQKGDLNLLPYLAKPNIAGDRKIWEKVAELVESREMPPEKKPQPSDAQRDTIARFIDAALTQADCAGPKNPGRVTIRRLNREEYHHTIRDLLGVDYWPEDFPADEVGYGFDNIGDVLSLSPMLMEKYLAAAAEIVERAIKLDPHAALPDSQRRLIPRMPRPGEEAAVAQELLGNFARRAYRRPVTDEEVGRLARFVEMSLQNGGSFLEGMQIAVQAALCSPHFLFRWELDPPAAKPGEVRALNDYEVASRLSYFLWNSMPDEELFALAAQGALRRDGNLEKQAARLLKDWRARSFFSSFAGQWLQIRGIWEVGLDPGVFKGWDDRLKGAMKEEAELFFQAIAIEDRPVTDLLAADFTFVNEKLARHYGIAGVQGENFQRVTLPPDSPRGGVLTMGSVLVSTSTPTRTSPVIRGKWILEQILGTPPPPPPPNVPPLENQSPVDQTASLRKRLEEHASRAKCAGCHQRMDPLGFALENFDATGAWRDTDGKYPIEAAGKLPSGIAFTGPRDLKTALKSGNRFVRSFTEKLMIYALGRGLHYSDRCVVDAVLAKSGGNESRFSALVAGIVTSDPFLKRKLP